MKKVTLPEEQAYFDLVKELGLAENYGVIAERRRAAKKVGRLDEFNTKLHSMWNAQEEYLRQEEFDMTESKYDYIAKVHTENTGGGCMVDYVSLKSGVLIGINDECICVFATKSDLESGHNAAVTIDLASLEDIQYGIRLTAYCWERFDEDTRIKFSTCVDALGILSLERFLFECIMSEHRCGNCNIDMSYRVNFIAQLNQPDSDHFMRRGNRIVELFNIFYNSVQYYIDDQI